MENDFRFSVCIPVYHKEKPENLIACLESMVNQSLLPDEILLLTDDPSSEGLDAVMDNYMKRYSGLFHKLSTPRGGGLGNVLRNGVLHAAFPYVARMDADDIALPNRFEIQINRMKEKPEIDLLGGDIQEFIENPEFVSSYRIVPKTDKEIKKFLRKRNPFNHMTVIFKKEKVLQAGNYCAEMRCYEDYFLWTSMWVIGCVFENLDEVLVKARTGDALYARRGGWNTFQYDLKLSHYKYKNKLVSLPGLISNIAIRFVAFVVLPRSMRKIIYEKFLRKSTRSVNA